MKSKLNNRLTNIFILIISVCVSISSLASFPALAQDEQPDSAIVAPAAMAQQQALLAVRSLLMAIRRSSARIKTAPPAASSRAPLTCMFAQAVPGHLNKS